MSAVESLSKTGYAFLSAAEVASELQVDIAQLNTLAQWWSSLPRDEYLRDGGRYRSRRHSCFIDEGGVLTLTPHRAHWQPTSYNALHGGLERWFEPIAPEVLKTPTGNDGILGEFIARLPAIFQTPLDQFPDFN